MQDPSISTGDKKYFAFLSYAHKDAQAAAALGRYIETFRVPVRLGGKEQNLPKRMFPIFRDREEFSASSDLGAAIQDALASSGALLVLCSPSAAQSKWVNEEIRTFRRTGNPKRIVPVLLEGEPSEAFPPALTEGGVEPLAVDFRQHQDNLRDAHLRLIAALLGVDFDALKEREALRVRYERLRVGVPVALWQVLVALLLLFVQRDLAAQVIFGGSWRLVTVFGDVAIGIQLLAAIGLLVPQWPRLSGLLIGAMISQALVLLECWGLFVGHGLPQGSPIFVPLLSISFILELIAIMYVTVLRNWLGEFKATMRAQPRAYGQQGVIAAALLVLLALDGYAIHAAWAFGFHEYALAHGSAPEGIATGPDGALWFTEDLSGKIGRITTGGKITEYALAHDSAPDGIASGPDGALWFTEFGSDSKIGRTTTGGKITKYALAHGTDPDGIASGPDGALWFTEFGSGNIGRITTGGKITEYALAGGSSTDGIASGPDGALWFTEDISDKIGRITTGGKITEYALAHGTGPEGIASGPDGALWFTELGSGKIGRITTGGRITEYALAGGSNPDGIASGPDGALWFTELGSGNIGRITTGGKITEYALARGTGPEGIASGPDGALWFTESDSSKIGRL